QPVDVDLLPFLPGVGDRRVQKPCDVGGDRLLRVAQRRRRLPHVLAADEVDDETRLLGGRPEVAHPRGRDQIPCQHRPSPASAYEVVWTTPAGGAPAPGAPGAPPAAAAAAESAREWPRNVRVGANSPSL